MINLEYFTYWKMSYINRIYLYLYKLRICFIQSLHSCAHQMDEYLSSFFLSRFSQTICKLFLRWYTIISQRKFQITSSFFFSIWRVRKSDIRTFQIILFAIYAWISKSKYMECLMCNLSMIPVLTSFSFRFVLFLFLFLFFIRFIDRTFSTVIFSFLLPFPYYLSCYLLFPFVLRKKKEINKKRSKI